MAVSASLNVQWRTNSRRSVGGSNGAAIWASVSCCRRISRISPEVKTGRPADPAQGVDERAAPQAKDAANRGLHRAAVDAELNTLPLADFRGPAPAFSVCLLMLQGFYQPKTAMGDFMAMPPMRVRRISRPTAARKTCGS